MQKMPTHMTVVDYCRALERGEIVVNRTYQRSDQVWPAMARSYLIESILLDFPIPKLSLHQVTDVTSRKTVKHIVDGQQRSFAILAFYQGELRLSHSLETKSAAGRIYEELDEDSQQQFLGYNLDFDLFIAATEEEVRETFRRMNSFTVPLNPEEQRHAVWQGTFKWFINRLAKKYDEGLLKMGIFSENQLIRMQDAKLLTELAHAFFFGISTTSKTKLDGLYRDKDDSFPEEKELDQRLSHGLDQLLAWDSIHHTSLMKPFVVYSLVLAIMHLRKSIPALETAYPSPRIRKFNDELVLPRLTAMADALDEGDTRGRHRIFVNAASAKTNVESQRRARFIAFCRALS